MKYSIFILSSFIFLNLAWSQVHLGESISSQYSLDTENIKTYHLKFNTPTQNISTSDDNGHYGPMKIGDVVDIALNTQSDDLWQSLGDGSSVWRVKLNSENATFLSVLLSNVVLKNGASIDMFSEDDFLGGIDNTIGILDTYLSDKVEGKSLILEFKKKDTDTESSFDLKKVILGFVPLNPRTGNIQFRSINQSTTCNYDADCTEGSSLNDQKTGVAQLLFIDAANTAAYNCSGVLMNNTLNNKTPYLLSANHCFSDYANNAQILGLSIKFNWKSTNPQCPGSGFSTPNTASFYTYNSGGSLKSNYEYSDFSLLQLNTPINATWNVYFNGWDRSSSVPNAKSLHHPSGDVMKLSVANFPLTNQVININDNNGNLITVDTWETLWNNGLTEGGSSGGPLYNSSSRVIGQLLGGASACVGGAYNNDYDYYGRFLTSWNGGGTSTSRLKDWLDPIGSNPNFLDGLKNMNLGVNDIENNAIKFTLFPNPVTSNLNLKFENTFSYTYEILNSLGQYIKSDKAEGDAQIDVSSLYKGVYVLKIYTGDKFYSAKFVKQ